MAVGWDCGVFLVLCAEAQLFSMDGYQTFHFFRVGVVEPQGMAKNLQSGFHCWPDHFPDAQTKQLIAFIPAKDPGDYLQFRVQI
jgi:hypothetical protein